KLGQDVGTKACESAPIQEQYQLGQMVGLRGTPAIVTESGELISGYLPANALAARLESLKTPSVAAAD
ncbi:MAG: thioredoxin fold domain-containing protein, partial [Gammaproteobacteria bacterium]|nr:thioredoxin fold domain-containing protein [Gammaproteobacteria bacterium]